jgi:hypothetical protein
VLEFCVNICFNTRSVYIFYTWILDKVLVLYNLLFKIRSSDNMVTKLVFSMTEFDWCDV